MMGPFGTNPVHIDSQGNHVEPPCMHDIHIENCWRCTYFRDYRWPPITWRLLGYFAAFILVFTLLGYWLR